MKMPLIAIGVLSVAVLSAYGFGRLQASSLLDEANQHVEAEKQKSQQQTDALLRLEARRRLHLCLLAMENRNFGIAQTHLETAGRLLQKSHPNAELAEVANQIAKHKLVATENLSAERKRILEWVAKFDELVPPKKA